MTNPADENQPPLDCLLTLSLPRQLEEEVLDTLMAHPELAPGFTLMHGFGMGTRVALATPMEQVQGRARRVFVQVALPQVRVPMLVKALSRELRRAQITYWVTPLLAFGRIGAEKWTA